MIYLLYRYGLKLGLSLITLALSWDLITKGITCLFCFWKYSIAWKGSLAILIGLLLILASNWAKSKVIIGNVYNWIHIPEGKLK